MKKFFITKASDYTYNEVRIFDGIDELLDFIKECGCSVVVDDDAFGEFDGSIIIYDDYLE